MLIIELPADESYDSVTECFVYFDPLTVKMEHSLVSLSKWEAHFKKAFLTDEEKTPEETIYYFKCMSMTDISEHDAKRIYRNPRTRQKIFDYLQDPMCATVINTNEKQNGRRDVITAEILYYDLIALQIPFEVQNWNLNRLLTLIRVCSIKNEPPKKMTARETYARQKAINDANRAKYGM